MQHLIYVAGDEAVLYGPFDTDEQAVEWGANNCAPGTWHYIGEVTAPARGSS